MFTDSFWSEVSYQNTSFNDFYQWKVIRSIVAVTQTPFYTNLGPTVSYYDVFWTSMVALLSKNTPMLQKTNEQKQLINQLQEKEIK